MSDAEEAKHSVLITAIIIARAAPAKRAASAHKAGIPWHLITQLRRDLDAAGIDWEGSQ